MDSHPPFAMEDLTDEDFFNNLVEDDIPGLESRLGNLSIGDVSKGLEELKDDLDDADNHTEFKAGVVDGDEGIDSLNLSTSEADNTTILASHGPDNTTVSTSQEPDSVTNNEAMVPRDARDSTENLERSGCKEVQWSSYNTDVSHSDVDEVSYLDFFGGLADNSREDFSAVEDSVSSGFNSSAVCEALKTDGLENSYSHGEFEGGNVYVGSATEDMDANQSWDNLYPGWKYDVSTGQWYQVDESYTCATGTTSNLEFEGRSDASCSQENIRYVASSGSEGQTLESYANFSQHHTTSKLPDHMVIDPQYPGWYYDTISLEWRELASSDSSLHSSSQSHVIPDQNGFRSSEAYSSASYSQNHDSAAYFQKQDTSYPHSAGDNTYSKSVDSKNHDVGMFGRYRHGGYVGSLDQSQNGLWNGSYTADPLGSQGSETVGKFLSSDDSSTNQLTCVPHDAHSSLSNHVDQQKPIISTHLSSHLKPSKSYELGNGSIGARSFTPNENLVTNYQTSTMKQNEMVSATHAFVGNQQSLSFSQQLSTSQNQFHFSNAGRSSAGRPPHALVTFGFGGKLVVMKDECAVTNSSYGSMDTGGQLVSILNLAEVVADKVDSNCAGPGACNYFHTLCQQSFPGPLIGGNVGSREVNKWIDERIANCESTYPDFQKGEPLRLLLSLLKIACQNYGKLRSPFGTNTITRESDGPESAVAKLFASVKRSNNQFNAYGSVVHCLKGLPSEGQLRATAAEVQGLLVSGRTKEALQSAQEGQFWGPALVLAAQLGDQFYVDTVKQMALSQLVAGSPLRTLCLLVAGQPADVFVADTNANNGSSGDLSLPQQPGQFGVDGMLNDWEENLAVITANRTKGDELVIIHLGDCLWKERTEVAAAHICYIVAEANFEPYSDSARLCLIGADHFKFPRTFASPEAIQRTELYEYSKVLGNSQFILLPFQPFKLIYAHMLAEVGKVTDTIKYCQAALKCLRTVRESEAETWKHQLTSLEDRAKTHLQGGFTTGPSKLVGKLLNFFDNTAHRVVGGLPPPIPSTSHSSTHNGRHSNQPRVYSSQSTMAMSSLIPSASMEPISEMAADGGKKTMHNRSVSEPDFGRTPRGDDASSTSQGNDSGSGRFRFGFGRQILQKTVAFVLNRSDRQAKLGDANKFYYDEKLNRWVEHGAESLSEEPALPPPPTSATFQHSSDDTTRTASPESAKPSYGSTTPPVPNPSNHFSARSRTGVRSRYVDTFNQGSGSTTTATTMTNLFHSPPRPPARPSTGAPKFFVPAPARDDPSGSIPSHEPALSSTSMQRVPSMGNISEQSGNGPVAPHSRRTASWGGSFNNALSPPDRDAPGMMSSPFLPSVQMDMNGGGFDDDLHEVEL